MTEAQYAAKLLPALRKAGAWAVKIHGGAFQRGGLPDILGCYRGRFFAFELKGKNGELTARQAKTLGDIDYISRGLTRILFTMTPVEEVIEWLRQSASS